MSANHRPYTLAVGGLAALAASIGIGRFVYTPILPGMMADIGMTGGQAGLIASANYAGYLIGALAAAGPLPLSPRKALALGLAASVVTTLAMAGLSGLWAMASMRFVGGVASAFVMVLASGLVMEGARGQAGASATGVHFAGVGVGIVLSALLVLIANGAGLGWRGEWLLSGGVSLLLAGMAVRKLDHKAPAPRQPRQGRARFKGGMLALILSYGLFGLGYVVTATFLATIIHADPALHAIEPFGWLVVGVTAMFSVPLWMRAAQRWGTLAAYIAACLIEALGVGASAGLVTQTGMLVAAALLGGTFMGIVALGFLAARERVDGDPRALLAWFTAAFGLGQIAGPVIAGFLHDRTGDFVLASWGAAAVLVGAALLAALAGVLSRRADRI